MAVSKKPIPSANTSFELFKKQAMENAERVGVVSHRGSSLYVLVPMKVFLSLWMYTVLAHHCCNIIYPCTHTHTHTQERLAKQQEELRKQQRKQQQHSEAELQRKREEGSEPEQRAKEDIEARKLAERERRKEEQRRRREAVSPLQ